MVIVIFLYIIRYIRCEKARKKVNKGEQQVLILLIGRLYFLNTPEKLGQESSKDRNKDNKKRDYNINIQRKKKLLNS